MKNIKINFCLILLIALSISGKEFNPVQKEIPFDTIKENKNLQPESNVTSNKKIDDYKKATDSILSVADVNNIIAEKELKEIKKYNKIAEESQEKLDLKKKEVKSNLNKLVIKLNQQKKNNSIAEKIVEKENNIKGITIVSIDSVLVKKTLFRKQRYDYIIKFSNGTEKRIKNN